MKRIFLALFATLFLVGFAHADKRFYLCDIIGDGTEDNPFRVAVANLNVAWVATIPSDPVTGRPLFDWAIVRVAAGNHSEIIKICDALPDFPMDGKVTGINLSTKAAMKSKVKARMGGNVAWIDNTDGYREVIRTIGKHLSPDFDENNFDVE